MGIGCGYRVLAGKHVPAGTKKNRTEHRQAEAVCVGKQGRVDEIQPAAEWIAADGGSRSAGRCRACPLRIFGPKRQNACACGVILH